MSWKVSKVTRTPVTDGEQGLLSRMVDKVTKTPVTDGGQGHKDSCHGWWTRTPVMEGAQAWNLQLAQGEGSNSHR